MSVKKKFIFTGRNYYWANPPHPQGNLPFWYWRTANHLPRQLTSERHDALGTWLWVHACNVAFPLFQYQSSYILYKLIINMPKTIHFLMKPRIVSLKFLQRLDSTRNYWIKSYLTDNRTNRRRFNYFSSG